MMSGLCTTLREKRLFSLGLRSSGFECLSICILRRGAVHGFLFDFSTLFWTDCRILRQCSRFSAP
jgi:hypothetical protein